MTWLIDSVTGRYKEILVVGNDKNLTKSLALAAISNSERAEVAVMAPVAMAA